jgi:hypothetical protein
MSEPTPANRSVDEAADHGTDRGPVMPPAPDSTIPATGPTAPIVVPPAPTFGRQAAQLIIIPAVIVILCIGMAVLFGKLAGSRESLDNNLARLERDSGGGRMAFGLQDPRHKERGLAAYNIATQIPTIKDSAERKRISDRLIVILRDHVSPAERELHVYLLTAVGQLGQPGGFDAIVPWLTAPEAASKQGAIRGVLSWPDAQQAQVAVPQLVALLRDEPLVAAEAAAALGELGRADDADVIAALRGAMNATSTEQREVQWNAAVALARLGDEQGSRFVVDVLLNPEALSQLPMSSDGPGSQQLLSRGAQDRLMLAVLASARDMTDAGIWSKIQQIADNSDKRYSLGIQTAARELLSTRSRE